VRARVSGRRRCVAGAVCMTTLLTAGCATSSVRSREQADAHAVTAGRVMTRTDYAMPSTSAAAMVVGTAGDTTIEALVAAGTTWDGSVLLRIRVRVDPGKFDSDTTTRCYRYDLDHTTDEARPAPTDCPATAPLVLTSPPPGPDLSADATALAAAFDQVPTEQRLNVQYVAGLLRQQFASPAEVMVGLSDPLTMSATVSFEDRCLLGILPSTGAARVASARGSDCHGG